MCLNFVNNLSYLWANSFNFFGFAPFFANFSPVMNSCFCPTPYNVTPQGTDSIFYGYNNNYQANAVSYNYNTNPYGYLNTINNTNNSNDNTDTTSTNPFADKQVKSQGTSNFSTESISLKRTGNYNNNNKVSASTCNKAILSKAESYVGKVNTSAEGNALFSPKNYENTPWYKKYGRWGWCCDFAVHNAKEALGSKYPKDMITSSPDGLANAAKKHDLYLEVPSSNKEAWVANNVKPGDIIYMKGKGDSGKHIAIVESVNGGKINAVSGNSGGKVRKTQYDINTSGIYGFIDFERLAA